MTRHHVFVVLGLALLVLGSAQVLGGGCAFGKSSPWNFCNWGTSSVNGVELPYEATLTFSSPESSTKFVLSLESASIVVEAVPSVTGVEAEFVVKERTPGDASLVAAPDSVATKSAGGNPVLVVSARVRLSPSTSVTALTQLGSVTVKGMNGGGVVSATSGAGRVELRDLRNVTTVSGASNLGKVSLEGGAGLGDVSLQSDAGSVSAKAVSDAKQVTLRSNLGSVKVETLGASDSLTCETDAGSVRVSDVRTGAGRLKSDLGAVRAENSTFDHLYAHTDLGSVRLNGCTYKSKDLGTDLGRVTEEK